MIAIAIEGYIEFIIAGYLGTQTVVLTKSGEVLSLFMVIFVLFVACVFMPIVTATVIFLKPRHLRDKTIRGTIGAVYEGVKKRSPFTAAYYFVFIFRRIIFLLIAFLITNSVYGAQ